jgi:hypothetical protein
MKRISVKVDRGMYKGARGGWGNKVGLQLVMQGYLVAAMISTSGWDVLLMVTLFLLGIVTLRAVAGRVTTLF